MAETTHSINQVIELEMIRADSEFYYQLVNEITSHPRPGVLPFGMTPYLSLFVIETYRYFRSRNANFAVAAKRQHQSILSASRTRTKLLNDSEKDISLFTEYLEWTRAFTHLWMNSTHTGPLAWLTRLLQPDMGLFFYGDHLIGTTQSALFNLGFEKGDIAVAREGKPIGLAELCKSIGYDIGEYIGFLSDWDLRPSSTKAIGTWTSYDLSDDMFRHEDKKAQFFLGTIFNGRATPPFNACLLLFLTTSNFLVHIFGRLVHGFPDTWFKVKFLTLYHLSLSLAKLQDYFYPTGQLSRSSKGYLKSILDDRELKRVRSQSRFRNILTHYAIMEVPEASLKPNSRYFGLIEQFFNGSSFEEVNDVVDRQLLRLSNLLQDWQNR